MSASATPSGNPNPAPARKLSGPRKWLYRLLAMTLVPALVFGVLELSLRIAGYGYPTDFFVDGSKMEEAEVWIDNPDFGRWVFPNGLDQTPQPVPFVLTKVKKEGRFRIFVLGESAAMGFPDSSTSFARVLEVMFRARYPDTRFEVVNTAMVAINSHVALSIARQCAERQPDLLVVHLGNNEVVGPFGAAGVLGPFSPHLRIIRANLAVKTTRTGQLLNQLVHGLGPGKREPRAWEGMAMFVGSQMRADDARLERIYSDFRANLQDICRVGAEVGIPVVLCTIPVNLRDSAPFASLHSPDLSEQQTAAWGKVYRDGMRGENEKKYTEAIRCYQAAGAIDDTFADLAFRLGRCYLALGQTDKAREQYIRARELDALRFRSDSTINETIREVAAANEAAGARLADAERSFARASPGEIPGEELFLEHVHMNFKGNYLLARTVFETITDPQPPGLGSPSPSRALPLSEQKCAEQLAYTEWVEWKFGKNVYEKLIQGQPFASQLDHAERNQRWKARLAAMQARLEAGGIKKSISDYEKAVQSAGSDWMIHMNFGELLNEVGSLAEAKEQYQQVVAQLRHSFTAHCKVGTLQLKLGSPRSAEDHFREALRIAPDHLEAHIGLAEALEGQGKNAEARAIFEQRMRKNPHSAIVLAALGRHLYRMGKLDEAQVRFAEAMDLDPDNATVYVDLGLTALKQENADQAIEHFEAALRIKPDWPQLRAQLAEVRKKRDAGKGRDR